MEPLYYVLDTTSNTTVVENLTHDQAMEWLVENGVASDHIVIPH